MDHAPSMMRRSRARGTRGRWRPLACQTVQGWDGDGRRDTIQLETALPKVRAEPYWTRQGLRSGTAVTVGVLAGAGSSRRIHAGESADAAELNGGGPAVRVR